jgi:DNA-binding response OmpR family regulator
LSHSYASEDFATFLKRGLPFGMGELMERLRTALRHRMQRKGETPVVSVGELEIDTPRRRVTWQGAEVSFSPKELTFSPSWRDMRARC